MCFPRPCRFVVERVGVLSGQFGISETLAADLRHSEREALSVVHILAVVVTEHLFVEVAIEMKRFHADIGTMQPALYEAPEVLQRVRVDAAMHVFNSMIYHLMVVVAVQSDIRLEFVPTLEQIADICTQSLDPQKWGAAVALLEMHMIPDSRETEPS